MEGCVVLQEVDLQELASLLLKVPFAPHEKYIFSNNSTIRNGWMEHLIIFYNMLTNNPLCWKQANALGVKARYGGGTLGTFMTCI